MSPTIVLKAGQPILAVGAAGGPTIITQTVGNIIGVLDLDLTLDAALRRAAGASSMATRHAAYGRDLAR
jgi:gamma-glutamyltranspeptidase/glutathione hydrolase